MAVTIVFIWKKLKSWPKQLLGPALYAMNLWDGMLLIPSCSLIHLLGLNSNQSSPHTFFILIRINTMAAWKNVWLNRNSPIECMVKIVILIVSYNLVILILLNNLGWKQTKICWVLNVRAQLNSKSKIFKVGLNLN